jgi:hypothetical protein
MTEEIFEQLGFIKEFVSAEEAEQENGFYYYTLDIGDICLISNADDEAAKNGWECAVFDSLTLKIKGAGDLEELVKILKLNTQ